MTTLEAFEAALWLSITADTEERTQKALDLASEIGFNLTNEQVSQAMAMIEKRLESGYEH